MDEPAAFVYLVQCRDGTYYCGIARSVTARVAQHNAGHGARYTRGRRPVVLVWAEPAASWSLALKRERVIKSWPREQKARLVMARPADG